MEMYRVTADFKAWNTSSECEETIFQGDELTNVRQDPDTNEWLFTLKINGDEYLLNAYLPDYAERIETSPKKADQIISRSAPGNKKLLLL